MLYIILGEKRKRRENATNIICEEDARLTKIEFGMVNPSVAWEVNLGIIRHLQNDGFHIELIVVIAFQ